MADLEENYTDDDTYEVTETKYRTMETSVEDENDEGTIEYLDLEMEVEALEEYLPESIARSEERPLIAQCSILKPAYQRIEPKVAPKYKLSRTKPAPSIPERSIMRTRSSADRSGNRRSTEKVSDNLASISVHDAVNDINAKLAESVRSVNGRGTKQASTNDPAMSETEIRFSRRNASDASRNSEMDSLDLFFQSMAQTVLNLPSQAQAKIKMDIYKVIATAEMKYCTSDNNVQGVGKT